MFKRNRHFVFRVPTKRYIHIKIYTVSGWDELKCKAPQKNIRQPLAYQKIRNNRYFLFLSLHTGVEKTLWKIKTKGRLNFASN